MCVCVGCMCRCCESRGSTLHPLSPPQHAATASTSRYLELLDDAVKLPTGAHVRCKPIQHDNAAGFQKQMATGFRAAHSLTTGGALGSTQISAQDPSCLPSRSWRRSTASFRFRWVSLLPWHVTNRGRDRETGKPHHNQLYPLLFL